MQSLPTFTQISNTGQSIIPIGVRAFSIGVMSGSAAINGTVYPAPYTVDWRAADSRLYLGGSIAVGTTGVGHRTNVFYTT